MSETKHKTKQRKPKATVKPPRAAVPPKAGPMFARPVAASPAQRLKRKAARASGTVTAKVNAETGEGEIDIYGAIGADMWGDGVTAVAFKQSLKDLGNVSQIHLHINSGGGDVFDATDIYNMLVQHPAEVHVEIGGVAASAATLIAMAGDTISIAENAHFMIHRASGGVWGNDDDVESYLTLLRNANQLLQLTYSRRTGLPQQQLADMMRTDNWMTAQQAVDHGFVQKIDAAKSVTPHVTPGASSEPSRKHVTRERLAAMAQSLSIAASAINPTGAAPESVPPPIKEPEMSETVTSQAPAPPIPAGLTAEQITELLDAREQKKAAADTAWRKEVSANLSLAFGTTVPADLVSECYAMQSEGIDAVRAKILEAKTAATAPNNIGVVRFTDSQPRDQHIAAIKAGLQVRALAGLADKHLPVAERPKDYQRFSHMPLLRLAEQCLLVDGFSRDQIDRLSGPQVAMAALGFHENAGIRAEGLHTTGSMLDVTKDAMNKSLTSAYQEAPQTWRGPFRQASSVPDFKEKHVISLSSLGNLPAWIDGLPPEQGKMANEREHYAVEARAQNVSFSWKLLVNDDMDALSRTPQLLGNAAARTVNAVVWRELTSNPTLVDGQALFLESATGNRKRSNLTTGSASPTNTTITAMRTKMRLMRGLNTPEGNESEDVLNLTPAYIMFPAALEGLITQQLGSEADPAASGNAGILNLSRYWGLTPVCEPLLDAASTTAWYLAASPSMIDTIEVSFLTGQETPVTFQYMDPKSMAQNFTIVQTYAAKAINHRGLQKHNGA